MDGAARLPHPGATPEYVGHDGRPQGCVIVPAGVATGAGAFRTPLNPSGPRVVGDGAGAGVALSVARPRIHWAARRRGN